MVVILELGPSVSHPTGGSTRSFPVRPRSSYSSGFTASLDAWHCFNTQSSQNRTIAKSPAAAPDDPSAGNTGTAWHLSRWTHPPATLASTRPSRTGIAMAGNTFTLAWELSSLSPSPSTTTTRPGQAIPRLLLLLVRWLSLNKMSLRSILTLEGPQPQSRRSQR